MWLGFSNSYLNIFVRKTKKNIYHTHNTCIHTYTYPQCRLFTFSVQINTFSMNIQIDLGILTVTKHITLKMENYNSSWEYLLLRGVFQHITDGEIRPWGQIEFKKLIILFGNMVKLHKQCSNIVHILLQNSKGMFHKVLQSLHNVPKSLKEIAFIHL